jgi:hypothetical protein
MHMVVPIAKNFQVMPKDQEKKLQLDIIYCENVT